MEENEVESLCCRNPVLTQAVILTVRHPLPFFATPPCRNPVLTQAVILTGKPIVSGLPPIPSRNPVLTQAVILTERRKR